MDELGANSTIPMDSTGSEGVDPAQVGRLVERAWAIVTSDPRHSLDLTGEAEVIADRLGYMHVDSCFLPTIHFFRIVALMGLG